MTQLGLGSKKTSDPSEYKLSDHAIVIGVTIDSAARDSGNTPTTTLRKGLVLGKVTASGKYKEYDDAAIDGTETAVCILDDEVKVVDEDGNAADAAATGLIHGYVDESDLIGIDANGKTDLAHVIFG